MRFLNLALIALLFPAVLFAQRLSHPVMGSRDDAFSAPRKPLASTDTVRVLAVMVQFPADADPRTTGNGRMNLSAPTDSVIDAPPHNARFFRDHLAFLENYFRRTSGAKQIVRTTLLDSLVTLSQPMTAYSPAKTGPNTPLAILAREAWTAVDSLGYVPDFSHYSCFVVFHAGVGRDIDLLSVLGYDPGPSDLPSLYLGPGAFKSAFGASYQGIPVNGGAFLISNSIILPETESRTIPDALGGNVLLQYTFNGLLCASVGNFLGLPDLFDTQTGLSGIGRFGLMDGQGIFSFNGTFPPAPSAWEKYWLGWLSPIVVPVGTTSLALPAAELSDTVYRVPISNDEYFLVENRNRDPRRTGLHITSMFNGVERQQYFPHDTAGFEAGDLTSLNGVVTDVDEPDWSLPGGFTTDGTFYDGGVLIWHIDEAVILLNLASDAVNADPGHRGVDVEEADGSQDIGESYSFLSAGSGSEEGTALDFWFSGNSSPVNKNEFSPTSFPDSRSYTGANSHITIRDFSARSPRMTATFVRGDAQISILPGFPRATGDVLTAHSLTITKLPGSSGPALLATTTGAPVPAQTEPDKQLPPGPVIGKLFAFVPPAQTALPPFSSSGVIARAGTDSSFAAPAAVVDTNGDGVGDIMVLGQASSSGAAGTLRFLAVRDQNADSLADDLARSIPGRAFTTPPVAGDSIVAVGATGGVVYFFRPDGTLIDSAKVVPDAAVAGLSLFADPNSFVVTGSDGSVAVTTRRTSGGTTTVDRVRTFGSPIVGSAVTGLSAAGTYSIGFVTVAGDVYEVDGLLNAVSGYPVHVGSGVTVPPALADVDGDGGRDIVVCSGSKIYAFNSAGASLDFFPYTVSASLPLASPPIVADVDGDGLVEVIAVTGDGLVVALTRNGKLAPGFPLKAGRGSQSAAVVTTSDTIALVVASSDDGSVSAWKTGSLSGPATAALYPWPQYLHDAAHRGIDRTPLVIRPLSSEFFPKDRAYNWPNPVYDGKTHFRYFVRDNATVSIKIFDVAGDLVTSIAGPGIGGIDNEIEWDASGVQSGVYLARVEASGASGSGVAIIKVAVVK